MRIGIIVEPDMANVHVGVRRVIRFFYEEMRRNLHQVDLLSISKNGYIKATNFGKISLLYSQGINGHKSEEEPTWASNQAAKSTIGLSEEYVLLPENSKIWDYKSIQDISKYDFTLISNPWLVKQLNISPNHSYSAGIVYDLVPNLLVESRLFWEKMPNPVEFAEEHMFGFEFYVNHCDEIWCISQSTRNDFVNNFQGISETRVKTYIPFQTPLPISKEKNEKPTFCLPNVLDSRKNFPLIKNLLLNYPNASNCNLVFFGRERMPHEEVLDTLYQLGDKFNNVIWFREPSDHKVQELLAQSWGVIFPSAYEGLGLPVLESQALGTPVISSDTSSLIELNLNKQLVFGVNDVHGYMTGMDKIVENNLQIIKGEELIKMQKELLDSLDKIHL